MIRAAALAGIFAAGLIAQSGVVGWPSMGLVTDSAARGVRDVEGVPAAALLSEPVGSGQGMTWIEAAPGRAFALGADAESGRIFLVTAAARVSLDGLEPGATGVRFSPGGSSAALLYNDHVVVLGGLPENRSESWRFSATAGSEIAVSDDGREAVSVLEGRLTRFGIDGSSSVTEIAAGAKTQFIEGSARILITAGTSVEELGVRQWQVPDGAGEVVWAGGSDRLIVAVLTGGELIVWDRASGDSRRLSCGCEPQLLSRIGRAGLYRLNNAGDGPVWLLDTVGDEPKILFIPGAARGGE